MSGMKSLFGILLLTILTGEISCQLEPYCNETRKDHIYPLEDPTMFYYCKDRYSPRVLMCPEGTGFQYNEDAVGCVPWSDWKCTYKGSVPKCAKGSEGTFTRSTNPTVYFYCAKPYTAFPLFCPDGSAYTYTKDMSGCVPWDMWECDKQIVI